MNHALKQSIDTFWKASEEVENAAMVAMSDCRSKLELTESRLMRGRILDGQLRAARAERYVLEIPIQRKKAESKV